jgi:hypothetical protein
MGAPHYTRRNFLKATALSAASLAIPACVSGPGRPKQVVSSKKLLHQMDFTGPRDGWNWPETLAPRFEQTPDGLMLLAGINKTVGLSGDGVHAYNGDSIELHFSLPASSRSVSRAGLRTHT